MAGIFVVPAHWLSLLVGGASGHHKKPWPRKCTRICRFPFGQTNSPIHKLLHVEQGWR